MKSYTDIEQSKKLAEFLPIESADMTWVDYGYCKRVLPKDDVDANAYPIIIHAWSLAALLEYLKQKYYVRLDHDGVSWSITCIEHDTDKKYTSSMFDDPIDACWGILLRLNKKE